MKVLMMFFLFALTVAVPTTDVFAKTVTCNSGKTSSYDDTNMSRAQKERIEAQICAVSGVKE